MATLAPTPAILFIDAARLGLYAGAGDIMWMEIPETVIHNYEVISKTELNNLVHNLVDTYKLTPGRMDMVFSENICFEKDFDVVPLKQKDDEFRSFFDSVPLERTLSQVYPFKTGSKAIAVNRDLYEAVRDAFEQLGFQVQSVIPAFVMSMFSLSAFDLETAKQLLKRSEALKQQTLVLSRVPEKTVQEKEEELAKTHTPQIIAVFIIFILVLLGATFFFLQIEAPKPKKVAAPPVPTATIQP